jgi:hypothetical protein
MSATVLQTANLLNDFEESEQNLILGIVKLMHENQREKQNREYLERVQGAIDRVAAGGGTIRELIEVEDDD